MLPLDSLWRSPARKREKGGQQIIGGEGMHVTTVADWAGFFSAEVSAAASLTGLVIVAISINLSQIIAHPHLPGRAIETLMMLVGVLLVASVGLVPGQPVAVLGCEILAIGLAMWLTSVVLLLRARGLRIPAKIWAPALRVLMTQLATLPFVIAGIAVLLWGPVGLYWLVPGTVFCLVAAVLNAWVLLVEIVR